MQDERELTDAIRELEERLLAPHVRADAEQLAPLLADDFLEFGSSGRVWTRAAVLEELPAEQPFSSSVRNFRVRRLAPYLVLATYRLSVDTGDPTLAPQLDLGAKVGAVADALPPGHALRRRRRLEKMGKGDPSMPPSHPPDKLSPAARLLGRSVTKSSPESHTVELEYEARPEFANRHGTISGGFLAAMLDSATAAPALLLMDATRTVVTTDLHVTFERPARVGRLTAVSQLVSHDDLEIHSKSELRDSEGKLVARAIATFRIVRVRVANPEKSS